jgi:nuclear pore complex protein Nup188
MCASPTTVLNVARSHSLPSTYKQVHEVLAGDDRSASRDEIDKTLEHRLPVLKNAFKPFGKPSADSRAKVQSGLVTLLDGFKLTVDESHKTVVFTISSHFGIDEIEALVLFRSYTYNEGLGTDVAHDEIPRFLSEFAVFFYQERRHLVRIHIDLHRGVQETDTVCYHMAVKYLDLVRVSEPTYLSNLITQYSAKTKAPVPDSHADDPRLASAWAKENLKDQLVMLEVLFWAMFGNFSRQSSIVLSLYEAAYATELGAVQHNSTLLLDAEGRRLVEDCASVWLLITILTLEVTDDGSFDITAPPSDDGHYTSSPDVLSRLHQLIISHGDSQYVPVCVAWSLVLTQLETSLRRLDECPAPYRAFFNSLDPRTSRSYSKSAEPVSQFILNRCLDPGASFLRTLLSLLTETPLFVLSIWMDLDSAITVQNSAYQRLVIKSERFR